MTGESTATGVGAVLKPIDGTTEDARLRAVSVASDTNREVMPVRVFEQGNRKMVSGVLPIRVITRVLAHNAAEKGMAANRALNSGNRPKDSIHVRQIVAYLLRAIEKRENYLIPSLTLNSRRDIEIYLPEGDYTPTTGFAVLPDEAAIFITDGQHRYLAIKEVVDQLRGTPAGENFMRAGVPVMMTIDSDLKQVHQDFADAGRTKPLPSSLLAVYDTRQPANAAVMEIGDQVRLLKGRIDATSSTLSINSPFVFLVNQVRQFVKSSLTGNPAVSEIPFANQAESAIGNPDARERWVSSRVAFLNAMTEIIDDWKEISELSPPGGADSAEVLARTKTIRGKKPVPLTAAFLNAIGVVSHEVLKDATNKEIDQANLVKDLLAKLEPLRQVNWDRSADIWAGNLVVDGKIRTQNPAMKAASQKLLELLG